MKIAIAIHHFDASKGGAERFAVDLARSLAAKGHDTHIFAKSCKEGATPVTFHPIKAINTPRFLFEFSFATSFSRTLKRQHYDVVIGLSRTFSQDIYRGGVHRFWLTNDLKSFGSMPQRYARFISRIINPKHWFILCIESHIYGGNGTKKFIAQSDFIREKIIKYHHTPNPKVEIIYNGVELEKFHPQKRTELMHESRAALGINNEKVILFVGHNFRLKGLYQFVQVISLLKTRGFSGFKGLVVGSGNRKPYAKEAAKLGCSELLLFLGPQREMARVYAASALLLQPTFFDPCSNTTLEALASGLPVVTTRYNGAAELITDGEEGYVVDDPRDIGKLADRVSQLLNENRLASCSLKAAALAERYPLQLNHSRIEELCREIAAEKESRWLK